jgi:cysteinyl-tRNA synthetase
MTALHPNTPLRIHNTLTRAVEVFEPREPSIVRMYTCGPTVYHYAHLGNMRSYVMADILRRVLEYNGYEVLHVKNITDVGHLLNEETETGADRMEQAAAAERKRPEEIAEFYTQAYIKDEQRLNILPPRHRPRATEYIQQMIRLIERLIEKGYAYITDGNVYFDVSRFPSYGQLSGNRVEDLIAGQRVPIEPDKRHPADFALWKAADPARFMKWESPWGVGFPGWHIECSAMALDLLGSQLDIHTGGVDNIFPHHEDERAQSEAATGVQFVRYWVHIEWLLSSDEKMSKSLGNIATLSDVIERGLHPLAYRYFLFTAHYRSKINMTWEALEAAQTALDRIWDQAAELWQEPEGPIEPEADDYRRQFTTAINDDLNMPRALAVLHGMLGSKLSPQAKRALLTDMDRVFALDFETEARKRSELTAEEQALIEERAHARARRNWARSDELRAQLAQMGIEVRDTPGGQRWVKRSKRSTLVPTSGA